VPAGLPLIVGYLLIIEPMKLSKKGKTWITVGCAVLLVLILGASFIMRSFEPRLRAKMLRTLAERFNGEAELGSLHFSWFPRVRADGKKFLVWYRGRKDLPPLISIEEFSLETGWMGLLNSPAHINEVTLRGLAIHIPPDEERIGSQETPGRQNVETRNQEPNTTVPSSPGNEPALPFVIETVHADNAVLRILPKKSGSDPLIFDLYKLTLHSVGFDHPIEYDAKLKNAKPPGLIEAKGGFGPWQKMNPASTPLSGQYKFQNADLSVFKGISGRLYSEGQFKGILEKIVVNGTTDTPDFKVRLGQPIDLKTDFHAVVDGTNGDTLLQPVTARFGKTTVICNGAVARVGVTKGKTVALDVRVDEGRIEDLMVLAVSSKPPMTGTIQFSAKFELPPGDQDVIQKLSLNGMFNVRNGKFTTPAVQEKVEKLSMRSRGRHEDSTNERIVSNMQGHFVLKDATLHLSGLTFDVPGAQVRLNGEYLLDRKSFDFRGTLRMQAKLSETQVGIKSILLKLVDPFFKKGKAGAVLPIKITGTLKEPSVELNLFEKKN
jgi:AsmA-like protein